MIGNNVIEAWSLFLDDERDPPRKGEWYVCRSVNAAIQHIVQYGMPIHISFDHDLGGSSTAMDLVKWIGDFILDDPTRLPHGFTYTVHSQNPVGAKNIDYYMSGLLKYIRTGSIR